MGARWDPPRSPPSFSGVLRQNSVRREVVDLPALIRRRSWFDDHPPAPAGSPPALSLRRPPPARPRKPRLAPAARRLQANGAPAEATLPAHPEAPHTSLADLAHVPYQSRPGSGLP